MFLLRERVNYAVGDDCFTSAFKITHSNISDSDYNLQSFHLAGPTLSIMISKVESYLSYFLPVYNLHPGFTYPPLKFRFHDLSSLSLYCQFLHFFPSVLLIHLCGKTLSLYEMIYLSYLCLALAPGNWVLLEKITGRTNWYHYKWWPRASTVPWILSRNSNAGLYSALTQTLQIHQLSTPSLFSWTYNTSTSLFHSQQIFSFPTLDKITSTGCNHLNFPSTNIYIHYQLHSYTFFPHSLQLLKCPSSFSVGHNCLLCSGTFSEDLLLYMSIFLESLHLFLPWQILLWVIFWSVFYI